MALGVVFPLLEYCTFKTYKPYYISKLVCRYVLKPSLHRELSLLDSLLDSLGESHSQQNSVRFKSTSPPSSPSSPSDSDDVTVSVPVEECEDDKGEKHQPETAQADQVANGDHQLYEVVTHSNGQPRRDLEKEDLDAPRYFVEHR